MAFFAPLLDAAREAGGELVIDGEGGDELFGAEPFLVADRLRRGDLIGALRLAGRVPGVGRPVTVRALRLVLRQWGLRGAVPVAIHERRPGPAPPDWLRPDVAAALRDDPWEWKRVPGPRWRAHLGYSLSSARDQFRVRDELRRTAALAGVQPHHPLLDPSLSELVLGLPPEEAFHPRHDRWLVRRAMVGLLPRSVLEREDKPAFGALISQSLLDHDAEAIKQRLSAREPAISAIVRLASIRQIAQRVRQQPGRRSTLEFWRMLALERWLRRQG